MAKIIRKNSRKNILKRKPQVRRKAHQGFFSRIKFTESYTSLILGAIVVLIAGILFISFGKINKNTQTSSIMDTPKTWEQISGDSQTSSAYTVNPGDDLWTISENIYNDGYRWVEIADMNKLENPGLIRAGEKLTIPTPTVISTIPKESIVQKPSQSSRIQGSVIQNSSITGNSYTVVSGDNLWDIAVRAYGDGFKWPEIAGANNLANPDLIHPGNIFEIPR